MAQKLEEAGGAAARGRMQQARAAAEHRVQELQAEVAAWPKSRQPRRR